jgi:hypothetical protein
MSRAVIKRPFFAVTVVSIILVIYCILINFSIYLPVAYFIIGISPLLLGWLAYTIIRFGSYKGKEFSTDEEWGYQDKTREELDIV